MANIKASNQYLNQYQAYYEMHKSDKAFNQNLWELSQRRGQTNRYIAALQGINEKGVDYDTLSNELRFDLLDADTQLFAIENTLYADRAEKKERKVTEWDANKAAYVDKVYNMSDFEWNDKLLREETARAVEAENLRIKQERKNSASAGMKFVYGLATVPAVFGEAAIGMADFTDDFLTLFQGIGEGINFAMDGKSFADGFKYAYTPEGNTTAIFKNAGFQQSIMDWESKYTYMRNIDGSYTGFGQYVGGVAYSLGEMLPTMLINVATAGIGGAAGMSAKAINVVGKITEGVYYAGLTSGTFRDMVNDPAYASVKSYDLMLNAAIKGTAEYLVQEGLNKVFGVSQMDKLMFNKQGKMLTKSGQITWKAGAKRILMDAIHEGMEETLQQFSGYVIDQFVGGVFKENSDWTLRTLTDAFFLGALSSIACSSIDILVKTPIKNAVNKRVEYGRLNKATDVDQANLENKRYKKIGDNIIDTQPKMSPLAAYEFRATEQDLFSAYNEAMSKNIDDETRAEIIGQMYATVRTLNSVYNTLGEERALAAVKMLSEMQANYKQEFAKTDAVNYVMSLYGDVKDAYVLKAAEDFASHPELKDKKLVRLQKKLDKIERKNKMKEDAEENAVSDSRAERHDAPKTDVERRQQERAEEHLFNILQRAADQAEAASANKNVKIDDVAVVENFKDGAKVITLNKQDKNTKTKSTVETQNKQKTKTDTKQSVEQKIKVLDSSYDYKNDQEISRIKQYFEEYKNVKLDGIEPENIDSTVSFLNNELERLEEKLKRAKEADAKIKEMRSKWGEMTGSKTERDIEGRTRLHAEQAILKDYKTDKIATVNRELSDVKDKLAFANALKKEYDKHYVVQTQKTKAERTVLVVDKNLADNADGENAIIKVLSENELRDTIINDPIYKTSVDELVKVYNNVTGLKNIKTERFYHNIEKRADSLINEILPLAEIMYRYNLGNDAYLDRKRSKDFFVEPVTKEEYNETRKKLEKYRDILKELGLNNTVYNLEDDFIDDLGWIYGAEAEDTELSPRTREFGEVLRELIKTQYLMRINFDAYFANQNEMHKKQLSRYKESDYLHNNGEITTVYRGISQEFMYNNRLFSEIYFTDSKSNATYYSNGSGPVIKANLVMKNPLILDAKGAFDSDMHFELDDGAVTGMNFTVNYAKTHGYDGVIIKNVRDQYLGTNYIVFDEGQVRYLNEIKVTNDELKIINKTPDGFERERDEKLTLNKIKKMRMLSKEKFEKMRTAKSIILENYQKRADTEEVVSQILFNDDQMFINSIVWSANEQVYNLLTHLQNWRERIETNNRVDEQVADKLDKTLSKLKKSLFEYTIAIDSEYTHLDLFDDKEKKRINTSRWVKDSGQAIVVNGELTVNDNGILVTSSKDTRIKNFVNTLNQMVNAIADNAQKQKIINGLTNNNRAARNQAMRNISKHYRNIFNSQYDGSIYLKVGPIANNTFNMWAQHNQVTVESILQTMQNPPMHGELYDAIRKTAQSDVLTNEDVFVYFRDKFESSTENNFSFVVNNNTLRAFQISQDNFKSLRESAEKMRFNRDRFGEQTFTRTFAETENGTSFNVSYGFTTSESATLSDIIYDSNLLTEETRDKIRKEYNAITPQTTFQYLRSQVLGESGGNRTILASGNNMFYYGEIANSEHLVPTQGKANERINKAFESIRSGKTINANEVVGEAFLQGRMTDTIIRFDNKGSRYDYENNVIYISSIDTLIDFVSALRHEVNHVFTIDNTGIRGFNERAFVDSKAMKNEAVNDLIRDLMIYVPDVYDNYSRLNYDMRLEIENAISKAKTDAELKVAYDMRDRLIAGAFVYESSNAEATAAGLDAVQQGGDFILQEYPTVVSMNGITMFWGKTYPIFGENARLRSKLDEQRKINTDVNEGLNELSKNSFGGRNSRSLSRYGIIPDTGVFYGMSAQNFGDWTFIPKFDTVISNLKTDGYINKDFDFVEYRRGIVEFHNVPSSDGTQDWTFEVHDRMTKQQYLWIYQTINNYTDKYNSVHFTILSNGARYDIDTNFIDNPLLEQLNKIDVIRQASRLNMGMQSVMTMDERFNEVDEAYKSILSSTERDDDTTIGMILPDGSLRYPDSNRDYSEDVATFHKYQEYRNEMRYNEEGREYERRAEWYGKLYAHSEVDEYVNHYFGDEAEELFKPYYNNLVQIGFNTGERAIKGGNRPGMHTVDVNIRILGDLTQSQYGTLADFIDGLLEEGRTFDVALEYQGAFKNAQDWITVKRDNMFNYKNGVDVLAKLALNGMGLPHFAAQRQPADTRRKITKKSVEQNALLEPFTNKEEGRKYERKIDKSVFDFVNALKPEDLGKLNKGLADLVREGTLTLHTLGEFIRDDASLRSSDPTSTYTLKMIQDHFYHNDNVRTPEKLAFLERYEAAFSGVKYIFNQMLTDALDWPERIAAYKSSLAVTQAQLDALRQINLKEADEKTVNKTLRQMAELEIKVKQDEANIDLLERKINTSKHYIDLANKLLNEQLDETFFESIVKELMNDPDYGESFTKRLTSFEAGRKRVKETGRSEYTSDVGIAPGVIKEAFVKSWLGTLTDAGSIVNSAKLFAQMGYNQAGESIQRKTVSMQQQSGKVSRTGDSQIESTVGDTIADESAMGDVAKFVENRDKIVRAQNAVETLERRKMLQEFQERVAKGEIEASAEEYSKIKRALYETHERITNMTYAELKKRYGELKDVKTEKQIIWTAQEQGVKSRSIATLTNDNAAILNVLNTEYLNTKAKRKAFVEKYNNIVQLSNNGRKVIFKREIHKESREVIKTSKVPVEEDKTRKNKGARRDGRERFVTKREKITVERDVSRTLNSRKNNQQSLSSLNDILVKAITEAREGRYVGRKAQAQQFDAIVAKNKAYEQERKTLLSDIRSLQNALMLQNAELKRVALPNGSAIDYVSTETMPSKLVPLFDTMYKFTRTDKTKVQYLDLDTEEHMRLSLHEFITINTDKLNVMNEADFDEAISFLTNCTPLDDEGGRRFSAIRMMILGYIKHLNDKEMIQLEPETVANMTTFLQNVAKRAGTDLRLFGVVMNQIEPESIIVDGLMRQYGVEVKPESVRALTQALYAKDSKEIANAKIRLLNDARQDLKNKGKKNIFDTLWKTQRMFMLSAPGTWIRNVSSNFIVEGLNIISGGIGKFFTSKSKTRDGQYTIVGTKVSTEIGSVVNDYLIKNGLYKQIVDGLNKYSGDELGAKYDAARERKVKLKKSIATAERELENLKKRRKANTDQDATELLDRDIRRKEKNIENLRERLNKVDTGDFEIQLDHDQSKEATANILTDSIARAVISTYVQENQFDDKFLNKVHKLLFKVLSDDPWIKRASIRYVGKMLQEDYDAGRFKMTNDTATMQRNVLLRFADAYAQASYDYMHRQSFVSKIERVMRTNLGAGAFFVYKQLFPFATAGMNWFLEGLKLTPIGLGKAIYDYARLEHTLAKMKTKADYGDLAHPYSMSQYVLRRNLGKGIIGTIGTAIGILLGVFGIVAIDKQDDKVKLKIGDVYIDVSDVFGTSGLMFGMTAAAMWKEDDRDFIKFIDALGSQIFEDSIYADVVSMLRYNDSIGSFLLSQPESFISKFVPNILKFATQLTYTNNVKYIHKNSFIRSLEKLAVQSVPFISRLWPKSIDPFTGEENTAYAFTKYGGYAMKAFDKSTPLSIKRYRISDNERKAIDLGLAKGELTGKYKDSIGYDLSAKDVEKLNILYGQLNNKDLTAFYNNKLKVRVQMKDGSFKELTYNKMTDEQRKNATNTIMSKNATYAKIYVYTQNGGKYYASETEYATLKKLGIKTNVYKATEKKKGFN